MRVICLNTNRSATRMIEEVQSYNPDVVMLQEWTDHKMDRSDTAEGCFPGLRVAATRYLATLAVDDFEVLHSEERVLVTKHGDMLVVNTYLPANGGKARREHLEAMDALLSGLEMGPALIAGDFNMAPRVEDGWHGRNHSKYTTKGERGALEEILERHGLADLGAGVRWEATFEKMNKGKLTSFRCDLGLVSGDRWGLMYDHRFRNEEGMSDHSALILDMIGE